MKRISGRVIIILEDVDIEVENESISSIAKEIFPDGHEGCITDIDISDADVEDCE